MLIHELHHDIFLLVYSILDIFALDFSHLIHNFDVILLLETMLPVLDGHAHALFLLHILLHIVLDLVCHALAQCFLEGFEVQRPIILLLTLSLFLQFIVAEHMLVLLV